VPEALAHLWVGLDCGLRFAEEIGACSGAQADEERQRCWQAVMELGRAQSHAVEDERPSRRFLSVLGAIVVQGRGVLLPKEVTGQEGGAPLIGWYDEDSIYLLPEAAFQAVGRFCRDAGEPFPVRQEQLFRHLNREGLSECAPGRSTMTARVGGETRRVVRLRRALVEPVAGGKIPDKVTAVTAATGFWE
jgi:hypothetical protein